MQQIKARMKANALDSVEYEYCSESDQRMVWNDATPGVYGQGDTKAESLQEYASALYDHVLFFQHLKTDGITKKFAFGRNRLFRDILNGLVTEHLLAFCSREIKFLSSNFLTYNQDLLKR